MLIQISLALKINKDTRYTLDGCQPVSLALDGPLDCVSNTISLHHLLPMPFLSTCSTIGELYMYGVC